MFDGRRWWTFRSFSLFYKVKPVKNKNDCTLLTSDFLRQHPVNYNFNFEDARLCAFDCIVSSENLHVVWHILFNSCTVVKTEKVF